MSDKTGRKALESELNDKDNPEINVSDLEEGLYILELQTGEGIYSFKYWSGINGLISLLAKAS